MSQQTVEFIKIVWRIQTCQFEYLAHIKTSAILWCVIAFLGSLLSGLFLCYLGLAGVLCVMFWNYLVLFDKTCRVYRDGYRPQRWEYIGTIWVSFIVCSVIVDLIMVWPFGILA